MKKKKNKAIFAIFLGLFTFIASVAGAGPILGFIPGQGGLGDKAYNDMAYRGMVEAKIALEGTLLVEEVTSVEEAPLAATRMISQGASVIVINGYEYSTEIAPTIRENEKVLFILNEGIWPGTHNSMAIIYDHRSGAFLAGALSGWTTNTGKLGFIGAVKVPLVDDFLEGFRSGAKAARQDVQVYTSYLSGQPDGFNMVDRAYLTALDMAEAGVDIILSIAGLSNNGVLQAASETSIYYIAVDEDMDHVVPGTVLVTLLKKVDETIKDAVIEAASGAFSPGTRCLGLKEGTVSLSSMKYTRESIGETILQKLELIKKELLGGGP